MFKNHALFQFPVIFRAANNILMVLLKQQAVRFFMSLTRPNACLYKSEWNL
jgi:hypothetical protein